MKNGLTKIQVTQKVDTLVNLLEEILANEGNTSEEHINLASTLYLEIENRVNKQTKSLLQLTLQTCKEIFEQNGTAAKSGDMNKVFVEFGTLIKKYRVSKNLSIAELSKESGISPGYVSNLERGKATNVAFCMINSIVRALKIPKDEVLKTLTWDTLPE